MRNNAASIHYLTASLQLRKVHTSLFRQDPLAETILTSRVSKPEFKRAKTLERQAYDCRVAKDYSQSAQFLLLSQQQVKAARKNGEISARQEKNSLARLTEKELACYNSIVQCFLAGGVASPMLTSEQSARQLQLLKSPNLAQSAAVRACYGLMSMELEHYLGVLAKSHEDGTKNPLPSLVQTKRAVDIEVAMGSTEAYGNDVALHLLNRVIEATSIRGERLGTEAEKDPEHLSAWEAAERSAKKYEEERKDFDWEAFANRKPQKEQKDASEAKAA